MIPAASFLDPLLGLGYTRFAGVPCSFLTPFINRVISEPALDYIGATSEGEAEGINFGAYLGGHKTVTLCQNSGLGNTVNPLTSLNHPFRVPTLLITTWRGEPGLADEPQHEQMGRITPRLLKTLEIPWRRFPTAEADIIPALAEADHSMAERSRPFALVMSQDRVSPDHRVALSPPAPEDPEVGGAFRLAPAERLTRTDALELALERLEGDEAIVATTGKTGRELFTVDDRPGHLYVVGGMGAAWAIGLGLARVRRRQAVVVFDGDGAALMKLGNLATIEFHGPRNLLHVILNNEAHDSTGGQRTASSRVRFAAVAAATGYRRAWSTNDPAEIGAALRRLRALAGPSLLHVKIQGRLAGSAGTSHGPASRRQGAVHGLARRSRPGFATLRRRN